MSPAKRPSRPPSKGATKARPAARAKAAEPAFPARELGGALKENEPLSRHTTFRIGGPARWLFAPSGEAAVAGALAWARKHGVPWLVLGQGSNVLVRDAGFHGLVVRVGKGLDAITHRGGTWRAGAGATIPDLSRRSAAEGYAGLQRLVGVPGSVGGGVYLNANAHGQDFASVLVSATVAGPDGKVVELPRGRIPFAYRHSGLGEKVVLGCVLSLRKATAEALEAEAARLLRRRKAGTPFDQPSCGAVFRNPAQETAGRLMARCGLKGRRVGGAEISALHANYIVNRGGASADDVLKLMDIARTEVFREFGIELEPEVKVLGGER